MDATRKIMRSILQEQEQFVAQIATKVSQEKGLPQPQRYWERDANPTTDPDVIFKYKIDDSSDWELLDWNESGAVAKVYHIENFDLPHDSILTLVWQEWAAGPVTNDYLINAVDRVDADILKQYPESEALGKAIDEGLPTGDLHGGNVGMTRDGRLVAYDL